MIQQDAKASWLHIVFSLRGSVLSRIWKRVVAAAVFATFITLAFDFEVFARVFGAEFTAKELNMTTLPFSLIGTALAIFLGFRNNSSYDRFWEGRKLWGRMINMTRTVTRQIMTMVHPDRGELEGAEAKRAKRAFEEELVRRLIAYVHAFRHHLRREQDFDDCAEFMDQRSFVEAVEANNTPITMLHQMGDRFQQAWRDGWIDTMHLPVFEESLRIITDIQGGCERIQKTPIPFAYTVLMHRIVGVYCFLLPFGIYTTVGDLTPLVVLFVSYSFFGLDAIGEEIEEPFGTDPNDLPLSTICRMLEIECRQKLGETDLPEPLAAVDHIQY